MKPKTIGYYVGGRDNNLTLIRLLAATAVLYFHSYALSLGLGQGNDPVTSIILLPYLNASLGKLAVEVFFVISGFLIAGSYLHQANVISFMEARILRIFPGLVVAVFFCVFVIGLMATNSSYGDYFSSQQVWNYIFRNSTLITGMVYTLPDVFENNPLPKGVNDSLWTLLVEFKMYIFIAVIGCLGLIKSRASFNVIILIASVLYVFIMSIGDAVTFTELKHAEMAMYFMMGSFLYVNKDMLPISFFTLLLMLLLFSLTRNYWFNGLIQILFLSYLVVFLAFHPKVQLPSLDKYGDYSYGIYIYGFPVQQYIAYVWVDIQPWEMFGVALPIVLMLALASWHLIEKPALAYKGRISMGC